MSTALEEEVEHSLWIHAFIREMFGLRRDEGRVVSGGKWISLFSPQDKELHPDAAPTSGPSGVEAQRRDEGVPGGRPSAAHPDGAPPLSAGPPVTEGPENGPGLRPEAGQGPCDHQGLCQIQASDGEGQLTPEERDGAPRRIAARCSDGF